MPILRACSGALATALQGGVEFWGADLFTLTLQSGTVLRFTSWDYSLLANGHVFTGGAGQFLNRSKWNVVNTMEVPTLEIYAYEAGQSFNGLSLGLRAQAINGVLDGASFLLQRLFMPTTYPPFDTTTYGSIDIFSGDVGAITMLGPKMTIKVRGKNSRLSEPAPRNVFQPGCIHTFCDTGCTLNPATFTSARTCTSGTTKNTVTFHGTVTQSLKSGTVTMTSGNNNGLARSIIDESVISGPTTVLTLVTPLPFAPVVGTDTFNLFTGCDKTIATCNNTYSNLINFRGFPFIPPPATTAVGQ